MLQLLQFKKLNKDATTSKQHISDPSNLEASKVQMKVNKNSININHGTSKVKKILPIKGATKSNGGPIFL